MLNGQVFRVLIKENPINNQGTKLNGVIWHNGRNTIELRTAQEAFVRTQQERCYLHEVIHGVLYAAGRNQEVSDEFIDCLAYGLHQALTMQSEEEAHEI